MRDYANRMTNGVPDEMRFEIALLNEKHRGFPLGVGAYVMEYEDIIERYGADKNVIYAPHL